MHDSGPAAAMQASGLESDGACDDEDGNTSDCADGNEGAAGAATARAIEAAAEKQKIKKAAADTGAPSSACPPSYCRLPY